MYKARNNENEWLWEIGDRRVNRLYKEYVSKGFVVITNKSNHEGPDLIVISSPEGKIVKIIESTNYQRYTIEGKPEHISNDKMVRYYQTLNRFSELEGVEKELVVSYGENVTSFWHKKLKKAKIRIFIVGHQD